jgi:hypothetical protein
MNSSGSGQNSNNKNGVANGEIDKKVDELVKKIIGNINIDEIIKKNSV